MAIHGYAKAVEEGSQEAIKSGGWPWLLILPLLILPNE